MSFSFFRGEDIFPRAHFRVPPPFLRNYTKTGFRHLEDEQNTDGQQLSPELDGTVQGRSLGKANNPCSFTKPGNAKVSVDLRNTSTKQLASVLEKTGKPVGVRERTDMNRSQLTDLHRSIQTRLTGPALESIDLYPLAGMRCTGQRMNLAECQQNQQKRGSVPEEAAKDSLVCEQPAVSNGATTGVANSSNAVSLNKLYSCLKRMKCRRNDVGQYEDLATISMNGREPCFSRSYFQRVFATNNAKHPTQTQGEQEEIFLLLGGKSKPVRFPINSEGLNLLEKEWRVELKSRDSIFCTSDEESLQLLQKFRARFRLGSQRPFMGRKTPSLPIPWARHVVHKGRCHTPEEKEQLEEEETGRKLSIHVYLPNAGWEEQRDSTPATPIFSPPSR